MKKFLIPLCFTIVATVSAAFTFYGDDILVKLGIDKGNANSTVLANVAGDEFQLPYAKLLPSIVQGDKVGAAKELCIYIKEYCKSEEFKQSYAEKRESEKPTSEPPRMSAEDVKSMKGSLKQVEDLMNNPAMKSMPKEVTESYKKAADEMKKKIAENEELTPNKTKWEKEYPANTDTLIKRRLLDYLRLVASVDFDAALTIKGGQKIFTNPAYENKSNRWKACFRAGKEVNDVVKLFAQQWLKEL